MTCLAPRSLATCFGAIWYGAAGAPTSCCPIASKNSSCSLEKHPPSVHLHCLLQTGMGQLPAWHLQFLVHLGISQPPDWHLQFVVHLGIEQPPDWHLQLLVHADNVQEGFERGHLQLWVQVAGWVFVDNSIVSKSSIFEWSWPWPWSWSSLSCLGMILPTIAIPLCSSSAAAYAALDDA